MVTTFHRYLSDYLLTSSSLLYYDVVDADDDGLLRYVFHHTMEIDVMMMMTLIYHLMAMKIVVVAVMMRRHDVVKQHWLPLRPKIHLVDAAVDGRQIGRNSEKLPDLQVVEIGNELADVERRQIDDLINWRPQMDSNDRASVV